MTLPNEAPTAAFFAVKMPWVEDAACIGADHIFLENEGAKDYPAKCRVFCDVCPVRIECAERAMVEEGGADIANRYFVRGWLTPAQRISIQRRGGLKGRDPRDLATGLDVALETTRSSISHRQEYEVREVPPVPDEGDRWSKHHTTLARKLVRFLDEHIEKGRHIPAAHVIGLHLECNPAPLARVLEALVQDGTLDLDDRGRYAWRGGHGVVGSWLPIHLRFGSDSATSKGCP